MRRMIVGALLATLLAPTLALADRPLPSWQRYHADRAVRQGWQAVARGDAQAADTLSTRATDLDNEHVEAWRLRCAVLVDARRWTEASAAALQLTGLAPKDVEAALLAGRVSLELGVRDAALASFERAAELDVDDPRPSVALAMLAARVDKDWTRVGVQLREARRRDPDMDLSSLPLQDGWGPVEDEEAFLDVLGEILAKQR